MHEALHALCMLTLQRSLFPEAKASDNHIYCCITITTVLRSLAPCSIESKCYNKVTHSTTRLKLYLDVSLTAALCTVVDVHAKGVVAAACSVTARAAASEHMLRQQRGIP